MNKLTRRFSSESNSTFTENGAETYRSTKNAVLDFFYLAPARQGEDNTDLFLAAFEEDSRLALKCAFYIRDIRQGKGQRKTFRDILDYLYHYEKSFFNSVIQYVPEYGRWDDILSYVKSNEVQSLVSSQLILDVESDHPSLLGKWMPSENASSKTTKKLAEQWASVLGMTAKEYRKMLSNLRTKIGVVEKNMSAQEWSEIEYSYVPSRAMKLYRKAFWKQDEERFSAFINKAEKGEVKIHSDAVYPHEIVRFFMESSQPDKVLEAMWNQLPNYFGDEERNVLVMVDVSGSMNSRIGNTNTQAIHVSIGLGLYCAERNRGAFHNYFMTFSGSPSIEKIEGKTLRTRVSNLNKANWDMNTDIQAAFRELLKMAIEESVSPEEMPTNIIVISDMEFDACNRGGTNFENIKKQYRSAGYELPLVTFWNVQARNKQVPANKSDKGVFLVSGFSAETIGKVLNAEAVTPMDLMLEVLNSPRYAFIDEL